jgi:hypothetical protein
VSWRVEKGGAEGLVTRDEMWAVAHGSRLVRPPAARTRHSARSSACGP